jgi:hypothetical protein
MSNVQVTLPVVYGLDAVTIVPIQSLGPQTLIRTHQQLTKGITIHFS